MISRKSRGRLGLALVVVSALWWWDLGYYPEQDALADANAEVAVYLVLLGVAVWLGSRSVRPSVWGRPTAEHVRLGLSSVPALLTLTVGVWAIWRLCTAWLLPSFEAWLVGLGPAFYRDGPSWTAATLVTLVNGILIAPVVEERIFRGSILAWLRGFLTDRTAVLVSSVVFGLLRVEDPLGATLFGWLCAELTIRTESLVAPIVLHVANNGSVAFVEWHYVVRGLPLVPPSGDRGILVAIVLVGIGAFLFRSKLRELGRGSNDLQLKGKGGPVTRREPCLRETKS